MIIQVDVTTLKTHNLTPSQYVFLTGLNNNYYDIQIHTDELRQLIEEGYILKTSNIWILKAKGLELLTTTTLTDDDQFIEAYRNLFPKGVKSGNGTPIRGDKQGVSKKMQWFFKTYPEYSKGIIIEATTKYVKDMQRKGFVYMTQADYFINKDGASKLAGMCEEWNVQNSINSGEKRL